MSGHSGQFYALDVGKQTAKGTPQTTPKIKMRLTGGVVVPDPQTLDLPETDNTIQRSRAVKVGQLVGGAIEAFVRSDEYPLLAYGQLGAINTTGANPYEHVITAAHAAPYFTLYSSYDTTALVDRYVDCRITELLTRGGAGQALGLTAAFLGITASHGETQPVLAQSTVEPLVYPNVTVSFAGATTDIVEQFTLRSSRVAQAIQGDTGMAPSDIVLGRWSVDGTLRVLFETDAIWRNWLTDSPTGTTTSQALATEALSITASRAAASDQIIWALAAAEIRKVTLVPDPAGNPLFYDIEWSAQPQATIANTLSITVDNLISSY